MTEPRALSRPSDWSAMLDDAVHEINQRWGEPWGDDMVPMDQALVRETAEAVLLPVAGERDRLLSAVERAPHAKHCEAGASLFPGACSCWKRDALAEVDRARV